MITPARDRPFGVVLVAVVLMSGMATAAHQATGSLRVKTDVTGAQVILDGKEVGTTPLTLTGLPAGSRALRIVKGGYEDHVQTIEVGAQPASVFVVMKPISTPLPPLPMEFKAMHQHAFGYCTGVLTVSAAALDYKADKGDDVYRIPIAGIRSVSRSWGAVPGIAPVGVNSPVDLMAMRIEAPGKSYGFLAYKDSPEDAMTVASAKTKELFELVYRLWTARKP